MTRALHWPRRAAVCLGVFASFGLGACSDDGDDAELPVVDVGPDVVGTCVDFATDSGPEVGALPTVDCAVAHSHEVFAVVRSQADTYPGFEALEAEAQVACLGAFEPYVGTNPFDSALFYEWIVPTLDSWDRSDDREIICVAANHNGAPLTASVRDSNR